MIKYSPEQWNIQPLQCHGWNPHTTQIQAVGCSIYRQSKLCCQQHQCHYDSRRQCSKPVKNTVIQPADKQHDSITSYCKNKLSHAIPAHILNIFVIVKWCEHIEDHTENTNHTH